MELRNHLGILIIVLIWFILQWLIDYKKRDSYPWYVPIFVGVMFFIIVEVLMWIVIFCFL